MIRLLYKLFRKQILSIYAKEQHTKIEYKDLEKAFVDLDGRQYYRFPISVSLPILRLGKLEELIGWMSAGVSEKELHLLLDKADKVLTEGLLQKKNAAKIGAIISEIRDRAKMIIHTELVFNFLATQFVREDEDIAVINNSIHLEKIEAFKRLEEANSNSFFLKTPELRMLSNSVTTSEEEWQKLWRSSIIKQKALEEAMKSFQ